MKQRYFEKLTIYGKSGCLPCVNLCASLDQMGVSYNYVNTTENLDELEYLKKFSMSFPTAFLQDGVIIGSKAIKEIAESLPKKLPDSKRYNLTEKPEDSCESCT